MIRFVSSFPVLNRDCLTRFVQEWVDRDCDHPDAPVEELEYTSESEYAMPPMADSNRPWLVPLGEVLVVPRVETVEPTMEEIRDGEFVYPVCFFCPVLGYLINNFF